MIGLVLLAAGASRRFGSPKGLAPINGETMLRRAAREGAAFDGRCVVVLGAEHERLRGEIEDLAATIVVNEEWEAGMSSSIRAGLAAHGEVEAVIIALADQISVTQADYEMLAATWRASGAPIVAAQYGTIFGAPALFDRTMFDALRALDGDRGARAIIGGSPLAVPMPHAAKDVDVPADLD